MFDIERNMKHGPQYLTHLLPPSHLSSGTLVLLITEKSEMDSLFSLYLIVKFLFDFIFILFYLGNCIDPFHSRPFSLNRVIVFYYCCCFGTDFIPFFHFICIGFLQRRKMWT